MANQKELDRRKALRTFSRLYKTDPEFKAKVDIIVMQDLEQIHRGALNQLHRT